ncbi:hypothetical protein VaNZ11_010831 [Volvox africanus]|uniref:AAA+ ATPase domain-containing protein n=1 Tax=Volvox africanus TaxID=51714 RepID=A0ABQ5SBJ7_9CHLO|nr:hypothetical protein VaNZ11_010831 [Volvox africanus]
MSAVFQKQGRQYKCMANRRHHEKLSNKITKMSTVSSASLLGLGLPRLVNERQMTPSVLCPTARLSAGGIRPRMISYVPKLGNGLVFKPCMHAVFQRSRFRNRGRLRQSHQTTATSSGAHQPQQRQKNPSDQGDGPSTSTTDLFDSQQPQTPWLVQLLQKLKAPRWLIQFVHKYIVPQPTARTAALARVLWIAVGFMTVALGRELFFPSPRMTPREVLYSDFVTLLDAGRVRAARLEAGTSRLYFDVTRPQPPPSVVLPQQGSVSSEVATAAAMAATTTSPPATALAAASSAASATDSGTGASAATQTSAPSAAAASASASVRQRFLKQFYIKLADKQDILLMGKLLQAGVEFSVLRASFTAAAASAFLTALALWLPLVPVFWFLRRVIDQRQGAGRAKKASNTGNTPSTTFADVAGVDAAKAELLEVVAVMRQTKGSYSKLKVKMPSGVLLCGPPGTGKTLLVAGEAGVPFFAVSASEFVELFVGRGAARIRELFAEARKSSPCVVFIDELDGVGSRRGMGYNDERDQTLNQLLTELDGFDGRPGVLFLAATNRIDVLDPALLRPGRISRKVVVPLPDTAGRAQILAVHLRGIPLEAGLEPATACAALAAVTEGFSGAELANVVNEASMLAARDSREEVGLRDLQAGAQRTRYGVNGRSGGGAFGGGLWTERLQNWVVDSVASAAAAAERRPVKVGTGSG